jgi:hypothetical protein
MAAVARADGLREQLKNGEEWRSLLHLDQQLKTLLRQETETLRALLREVKNRRSERSSIPSNNVRRSMDNASLSRTFPLIPSDEAAESTSTSFTSAVAEANTVITSSSHPSDDHPTATNAVPSGSLNDTSTAPVLDDAAAAAAQKTQDEVGADPASGAPNDTSTAPALEVAPSAQTQEEVGYTAVVSSKSSPSSIIVFGVAENLRPSNELSSSSPSRPSSGRENTRARALPLHLPHRHIHGVENTIADKLSRVRDLSQLSKACRRSIDLSPVTPVLPAIPG